MSLSDWLTLRLRPGRASGIFPLLSLFWSSFSLVRDFAIWKFSSAASCERHLCFTAPTLNHLHCYISI
ncbi:hypothetical protein CHARACLAT_025976 [Characodon lateralis]|uniref:Secreted protein n=1 Tax=Characodon lateralis TaxID=208331 RepID=A0ABU7DA53_9TELE|nr:hypothetical protein [Characodon lateralis]